MSVMPNTGASSGMPLMVRTLMFWTLMIFLAIVLWQMSSRSGASKSAALSLSYSDFMAQVEAKNLQTARFVLSQNTAEVTGNLKQPAGRYETNVPRDSAASLMNTLRAEGTQVEVAEAASMVSYVVDVLPVLLLIGFWIYMSRSRMKRDRTGPNQSSPGALG